MATNNTSPPLPELPPLPSSNKRQKTNEGSVLFTNEEMMVQQQLQEMFALLRENGLPENNIPENPPTNATAKIKDTNEGGAKSVRMSSSEAIPPPNAADKIKICVSKSEAKAACGKPQEFKNSKGRAISRSKKRKFEQTPTSTKYRVNSTKASISQLCSHEGCTKCAIRGGVCVQHGAKVKRCGREGCNNQAQKGGVCMKHGAKVKAKKRCCKEGCTNHAKKGGVCVKHGAKVKRCGREGCNNQAVQGGVCKRHGAKVKK